ncbi:MAG: hypothetical protein ACJ73C_18330 [Nitrososphaeraceae archaeon]
MNKSTSMNGNIQDDHMTLFGNCDSSRTTPNECAAALIGLESGSPDIQVEIDRKIAAKNAHFVRLKELAKDLP